MTAREEQFALLALRRMPEEERALLAEHLARLSRDRVAGDAARKLLAVLHAMSAGRPTAAPFRAFACAMEEITAREAMLVNPWENEGDA
jgi:hypothetical protein